MSRLSERIENFNKAFNLFEEMQKNYTADKNNDSNRLALVQSFEIVCELGWKVLKDYLYVNGIDVHLPVEVIKEAFQKEVIKDGQVWIDMIKSRNALSHEYNIDKVNIILEDISTKYYIELLSFRKMLEDING